MNTTIIDYPEVTISRRPVFPNPSQVLHHLSSRLQKKSNELAPVAELLKFYEGDWRKVHQVSLPSRSVNRVIDLPQGKRFLKRYKPTVDEDMIRHEHSILLHLEQRRFPSPRLIKTTAGDTFVRLGSQTYALFDYIDGYFQYHHYLMLPPVRLHFIADSAVALGNLHMSLQGCKLEGKSFNGFVSTTGERWREVDWFLDKLDWCRLQNPQRPVPQEIQKMALISGQFSKRLTGLDQSIKQAEPSRTVIHGDYGPYNLMFKNGSPVIILDFELARLDWRLTDICQSLFSFCRGRLGFSQTKMHTFLNAYQSVLPISKQEFTLLPAVWQFLNLRRIVICWERWIQHGSERMLLEISRRMNTLRWIEENPDFFEGLSR